MRSASLWPSAADGSSRSATPHALLTSGSLHLSAYLLRLLDHHRPSDPVTFLQSVLRRGNGGMVLATPILLEFLTQATSAPTASLIETLRFSLMGAVGNTRDALWRDVTFEAARAMGAIATKQRPAADTNAAAGNNAASSPAGSGGTRSVFESSGVISADAMLPTFEALYRRGAPWQMLLAHNIVSSRLLMGRLVDPTATVGAQVKKPLTALHIVLELDGEDPASHMAFLRRADAAEGGELLQLVVEEIGALFPPSMEGTGSTPSFTCTLEIVLVSTTAALHNLQSATHHLFRLVSALVAAYQPSFGDDDDGTAQSQHLNRPPKPAWLKLIRLHLANRTTYAFPVLQALLSGAQQGSVGGSSAAGGSPPIETNGQHAAAIVWLRDARRHTELLLQLGHALHAFMDLSSPPNGSGPVAAWLDVGGSLLLDAHRSGSVAHEEKSKSTGVTAARSFLRHPRVPRQELLYALLLRQMLHLACGGGGGASRVLPATTPSMLLRVGSTTATLLGRMATALRANAPNLAEAPHAAVYAARFASYAAALYHESRSAAAMTTMAQGEQCPLIATVGTGMLAFAAPTATPAAVLLAALREAAYVRECMQQQEQLAAAADSTTTATETAATTSSELADGTSSSWSAALGRCDPTTLFDHATVHDPLIAPCLAAIACADRCQIEQTMQLKMPRSGVLSREVYVADNGVDEDGNPCIRTKAYVQEMSAQYLVDMMDGHIKTPAAIAAACEAATAAAAAAAATSAAAGSPPSAQDAKKKK